MHLRDFKSSGEDEKKIISEVREPFENAIYHPAIPHLDVEEAFGVVPGVDRHPFLVPVHADLAKEAAEHSLGLLLGLLHRGLRANGGYAGIERSTY